MDSDFVGTQLEKLEKSIRYLVKDSEWIFLEPVDDNLLEDLNYIGQNRSDQQVTQTPPVAIRRPASLTVGQPQTNTTSPRSHSRGPEAENRSETGRKNTTAELDPMEAKSLDSLKLRLKDCDRCQLCQNRTTVVFGQGNQNADLVFIGEGPGEEEDRTGLTFVGKAGKLLTQLIHSIGLNREAVYICNIVKCRPPGNRNPNSDEVRACFPFLKKQIDFLKPKLIVTLGNVATKTIIPDALGIMKMRGRMISYDSIPLMPTFHPSYLLRNPSALADVWTDMRKIRQALHQQISNSQS